ncbi:related to dehydrogenases with different specificities (related to short-chain alcohol dehydrogenases) [Phialocephala subalpina]|uniref:Related to dehydrogenases with different specificities (Related to short-chain alcohol dehydrogenases) n=1 Tax=Phialocephala subalpina TaxID=576137 RepID=A0A1L7WDU9_9HELO|nr:related to dehydrogenases with different specificities (related to short-chain alcohol dehydrogenases) [Phialocephala subalpina]
MSPRLAGRVAIVTGASSGLGRAIALRYAEEGATVMCADINPVAKANAAYELQVATHEVINSGERRVGKAAFTKVDLREEDQVKELVAKTVAKFGRLDIIVNCAGIANADVDGLAAQPGGVRVHELQTSSFDNTMAINTRGVFLGCKYALQQFLAQEPLPASLRGDRARGWIVNIASTAGLIALGGAPSYTTSKHAVMGLTKQIAIDYAKDKIHCNAVCPSFIDTPLISNITRATDNPIAVGTAQALVAAHPWGALGQPEDVASAAVFLASEDSQWMTGTSLVVDGGYTAQ